MDSVFSHIYYFEIFLEWFQILFSFSEKPFLVYLFVVFFIVSFCQYRFKILLQSVKYRLADFFPNRIWCHLLTSFNESPLSNIWATCLFSWGVRCKFLTSLFSIFVYLILFEKRGFQISMSRDFSEKIRNFSLGKTGLFQKIGNFAFSTNRTFPKNWEFHQNSLHIRFPILSKPVYIKYLRSSGWTTYQFTISCLYRPIIGIAYKITWKVEYSL